MTRLLPTKLATVIIVFDMLAMTLAYLLTFYLAPYIAELSLFKQYNIEMMPDIRRLYYYSFLCVLIVIIMAVKGHYNHRVPWWGQVIFIIKCSIAAFIFDGFTYFLLKLPFSRMNILINWIFVALLLIIARRIALNFASMSVQWKLPVAIIGDASTVADTLFAFYADGLTGYEVQTILLRGNPEDKLDLSFLPKEHPPIRIVNGNDNYEVFIRQKPGFFYVIALDGFRGEQRDKLMRALEESGSDYAIIPPIKRMHLHGMEPHYFFGNDIMLLHKRYQIRAPLSRLLKRGMDVGSTALVLPFIGLITVLVFLLKKLQRSESPVFYGGERVGKGGKLFRCWKFCTMKPGAEEILKELLARDPDAAAEWEKYQKLKKDPRVDSAVSALLRKTSLDELPQLWNVFCGDMSLVGPRPILPEQREEYGPTLPQYESVRPGLTGLWQVSGRNETSFQQRVFWDSWYVRNWSLWHDIVILLKTVRVFFTGSGAY